MKETEKKFIEDTEKRIKKMYATNWSVKEPGK